MFKAWTLKFYNKIKLMSKTYSWVYAVTNASYVC